MKQIAIVLAVLAFTCTYCADATTLAFIDGTLGPDGIRFSKSLM